MRNQQDGSHVHFLTVQQGRCPAMLLQPRHGYAADIHHGLPTGDIYRPKSHHTLSVCGCALLRGPDPPGSSRWTLLRSFRSLVPHVHLSVSLAGPGPSGSTSPFRRCQGCCPPSPSFQGSGCPQLQNMLAATSIRRCPFTTARSENASWRSMSVTHSWSGLERAKFLSTRSAGVSTGRGRRLGRQFPLRPARPAPGHQHCYCVVPDGDPMTQCEFGMNPPCSIDTP